MKQDSTQESGKTALNLDVPESGQPTQAGSENQGNNKAKGRKPIKTIYLIELGDDQTKQVIETTAEKLNEAIGRVHNLDETACFDSFVNYDENNEEFTVHSASIDGEQWDYCYREYTKAGFEKELDWLGFHGHPLVFFKY